MTSRGTSYEMVAMAATTYDVRPGSQVERPGPRIRVALEPEPSVVRIDHVGGRDHAVEPPLAQQAAATPDELAGGEVAVAGRHVVQLDAGDAVALAAHEHHADGLVVTLDEEREPARCGAVPDEVGLELQDVGSVDAQHVPQVLVLRSHLEHLEDGLVVASRHEPADVPEVD